MSESASHSQGLSPERPFLIVGARSQTSVGESLHRAALKLGMRALFADLAPFVKEWNLSDRIVWKAFGRRFRCAAKFENHVSDLVRSSLAKFVLVTGNVPLRRNSLKSLQGNGVKTALWLTDDPWNPSLRSRWLFESIRQHDFVFTTRTANLQDLADLTKLPPIWLPFASDETLFPPGTAIKTNSSREIDVLFVGGPDQARASLLRPLIESSLNVQICGANWHLYKGFEKHALGQQNAAKILELSATSKVNLIVQRRANRDGHTMRTFEAASIGCCILAEWSKEHEDIFGGEDQNVKYFKNGIELRDKAELLASQSDERIRLSANVSNAMSKNHSTYVDRLRSILECIRSVP